MTAQHTPQRDGAFRRLEDRLRAALTAGRVAMWQWDPATDAITSSDTMAGLLGLRAGESIRNGAQVFALVHPEDRENHHVLVEQAVRVQGSWHNEYRVIRASDGALAWIEERGHAVRNPHSGRVEMVGVAWDITERKRAEEALRETQARQAFLLELGDRFRPLTDPYEIMRVACAALARHLQVATMYYSLVEPDRQTARIAALHNDGRLPHFAVGYAFRLGEKGAGWGPALRAGTEIFCEDTEADRQGLPGKEASRILGMRSVTAVPLMKAGRLVAWMSAAHPQPRTWSAEERQLHREVAERTWWAVERARADEAVRRSEEKYRALFTSIDEGFCIQEVVFDDTDCAIDSRYLEVNGAFEKLTGLQGVVGRTSNELLREVESSWVRIQGEVALTGQPVRFEHYVPVAERWFDIYSFRIGEPSGRKVASVFTDITERRGAEERLRRAAQFDAFRVALNDALRGLADPAEVQATAARVLGERLGVNRAFYDDVERAPDGEYFSVKPGYHTGDVSHEPRRYRVPDVGGTLLDELRAGHTLVIPDVEAEPRFTQRERHAHVELDVRAYVSVPLIKDGRLVAVFTVQQKHPRAWTAAEIALIEETAERTWAAVERARAEQSVRQSHASQAFLLRLSDALRPLADAGRIPVEACRLLGEHLALESVHYGDVEDNDYVIKASYAKGEATRTFAPLPLSAFGETLIDACKRGGVATVQDVDADPRLTPAERAALKARGIVSWMGVWLSKPEGGAALLTVHGTAAARAWTPSETGLVGTVAERIFATVDRAAAEATLHEWEARLQKAFSIETVGVLFFNLDGRIIEANAAFQRMSGFTRDELLGTAHWEALTAPEFREVTQRAARDLAARGETPPYEKQLVRKDGTRWWGLFAPTRLKGSGSEAECVEFVLDITASKRNEDELRRAREELEERVRERTRELGATNASLREQIAERRRAEAARSELLRQLVNAQEAERRRISRELHDELGQLVSALLLKLTMLKNRPQLAPDTREELGSLEKIARDTDSGLDFLVWQLRPTALDDLGLVAALGDYAHDWSRHFGIEAKLSAPHDEPMRLDPEIETVLYRVAQEALNNVAKHSGAKQVEIAIERSASHVSLRVHDDGVGFDEGQALRERRGLGLVGMRERATLMGGELEVRSTPGAGTRVQVRVPLVWAHD